MALLEVSDLSIQFDTIRGQLNAIDRISFTLEEGETLGVVGESGCGKSITSLGLMGLLPSNASLRCARLQFAGKDLSKISETEYRNIRGGEMAMIFQDPMTSLNPSFTVGFQINEVLRVHEKLSRRDCQRRAIELLDRVGIAAPETRLSAFAHQLSGGMCQRVMIAMAIACRPRLLIADEPTTALDVTIQAQILDLLSELQKDFKMALMLITHDIAVVGDMADKIMVMYAGQIVEMGPAMEIIQSPKHPYTKGLLNCLPGMHDENEHKSKLPSIPGLVPDLTHRPLGCQMHPRCDFVEDKCRILEPELTVFGNRSAKCFYPLDATGKPESKK